MTITVFSTALDLGAAIGAGTTTSRVICQMYLDRIAAKNYLVNAVVIQVPSATILALADAADARAASARAGTGVRLGPLDGVPITLKMPHRTLGIQTANAFGTINYTPTIADGDIAARLKAKGLIILGKTNAGQYPFRTKSTLFGETKNPFNLLYATGGSSGGPSVAVAMGFCAFDVAIDSAGSGRIPESFCGVCGFKPTNNSVSGFGDSSSCMPSQPPAPMIDLYGYGATTRSLADTIAVHGILAGPTQMRSNCPPPASTTSPTLMKAKSITQIGPWTNNNQSAINTFLATQSFTVDTSSSTISWFDETALNNCYLGLSTDPATFSSGYASSENAWYASQLNYANSYAGHPQSRVHALWLSEVLASLFGDTATTRGDVDVLVLGTTALLPPLITAADPSSTPYEAMVALFNLTGNPCVTVPLGVDSATGIPYGLQFVGRHHLDNDLLHYVQTGVTGLPGFVAPTI
jgi:Asp-tRNA(Asn)/Glu-tRNA(Gln) amidotransferase A subunit family amidase